MASKKMTERDLVDLFEYAKSPVVELAGNCHDCGREALVVISITDMDTGAYKIEGGAVWKSDDQRGKTKVTTLTVKCPDCFERDPILHDIGCEVFSRVCGYLRPMALWNAGKQQEAAQRVNYKIDESKVGS
jgi:hypothetical protein